MNYFIKLLIISIVSIITILLIGEFINDKYDWPENVKILSRLIIYHKILFILMTYFIIKSNSFFIDLFGLFFVQFLTLLFHFVYYQNNDAEDIGHKIFIFSIGFPFFILLMIYIFKYNLLRLKIIVKNWIKEN